MDHEWQGKAVQLRRIAMSMTLQDLTVAVTDLCERSVTMSTVCRWEKGHEPRRDEHKLALGQVLGCSKLSFYRRPTVVDAN
jgi:hypothetical protein